MSLWEARQHRCHQRAMFHLSDHGLCHQVINLSFSYFIQMRCCATAFLNMLFESLQWSLPVPWGAQSTVIGFCPSGATCSCSASAATSGVISASSASVASSEAISWCLLSFFVSLFFCVGGVRRPSVRSFSDPVASVDRVENLDASLVIR